MIQSQRVEWGAFILRITLGVIFLVHGWAKFSGGIDSVAGWFSSIGLPGLLAYVVVTIELVGGILLILGLGTRVVSVFIGLVMIGAIVTVKFAAGFMGNGQMTGYEYDVALLAMAIYLSLTGNSFLALDQLFFGKKKA